MKEKMSQRTTDKHGYVETSVWWVLAVSAVILGTSLSAAWARRAPSTTTDPNATVRTRTRQAQVDLNAQPVARRSAQEPLALSGQRLALQAILEAAGTILPSTAGSKNAPARDCTPAAVCATVCSPTTSPGRTATTDCISAPRCCASP